jgi:hypothetical protein
MRVRLKIAFVNFGVPSTGGELNHMAVPNKITIVEGGIVNFVIASGNNPASPATGGGGFHQITVYKVAKNTKLDFIEAQIKKGFNLTFPI